MKTAILLFFLFISCPIFRGDADITSAKKEMIEGILLYEFQKNGDYYCELNNLLIMEGNQFFFYDVRNFNVGILHKNKNLQLEVGVDTLYSHFTIEPDSSVNLNFSSFKRSSYNRNGISTTTSPYLYSKKGEESVYVAFNLKGEAIHYRSISLGSTNEQEHAKECCPKKNKAGKGEFYVLSRVYRTSKLTLSQEVSLSLTVSHKVGGLDIFYCD